MLGSCLVAGCLVAGVSVEAPEADRARLLGYVEIAPGEPLRLEAVRAAVRRLYATGEFADVVVDEAPAEGGVWLRFRPLPAPLLRGVRVVGDRVLSEGDARKAARLQDGEPLWPARLETAASAVAVELVRRGFLEARVEVENEAVAGGVVAAFQVAAGPRVHVAEAVVEGAPPGTSGVLEGLVRPRQGDVFDRARAQASAERMRLALVSRGRWQASVRSEESYDPRRARMSLRFVVEAGPWHRLEFRGDPVPAAVRRAALRSVSEGGVRPDALDAAVELVEDALFLRGHRGASVSHRFEAAPGGRIVVLEAVAGPAWTAASVQLSGADAALLPLVKTRAGDPLRDRVLEEDQRSLTRALEDAGHPEARVELELGTSPGAVPVVFRAEPGPRVLVESFGIEVSEGVAPPRSATPRELRLRAGEPYRLRDLGLDRRSLMLAWRNAGYLEAEVTPEVRFDEPRTAARVLLRVEPGEQTRIDRIIVRGLRDTREVVVRRELSVAEGGPLGLADVLDSQRRLGALPIFERASLVELPGEETHRRSLLADVREARFTTFSYGLGYGDRDKLRGSVEVTRRNLFGMDRSLTAFARGSFVSNRFLLSYREPYLLGRRLELFVTGFREEEDREGFDYVRGGALVQSLFDLKHGRKLIGRLVFQTTDTFNVTVPQSEVDRQFQDATISGPSFSVLEDSRDDPLDPRRGHFVAVDAQLSLRLLGGDPFVKSYLQAASYRRVLPRTVLAVSARLGLSRTFGFEEKTRLPLPERFFAGGDFSLRGFPTDSVLEEGGNGLLLGSVELRFDASPRFAVAVFSDLGNVYPFVSDIDPGDVRASAGAGLRYKSAFGPLRLDWAAKLDRRPGESASRFHLTVGHAF
jgi:outer membrane protein assembly factor BamA